MESPFDYALWLKLSRTAFYIEHDIVLGFIYQQPELLEIEMFAKCIDYNYVNLMGDINARTSNDDFTESKEKAMNRN